MRHAVYNKKGSNKGRPVTETTTMLTFPTIVDAAKHFKITTNAVTKSANNRTKAPQHPYKFKWVTSY